MMAMPPLLSLNCRKQQSRHDHIIDSHSHVRNDEGQDHQGDGTSLVRHQGISELKKSQSCGRWNIGLTAMFLAGSSLVSLYLQTCQNDRDGCPASASGTPKETRKPKAQVVNVFKATCRADMICYRHIFKQLEKPWKTRMNFQHHHFIPFPDLKNHLLDSVSWGNICKHHPKNAKRDEGQIIWNMQWWSMMAPTSTFHQRAPHPSTVAWYFRMIELITNLGNHLYSLITGVLLIRDIVGSYW